MTSILFGYIYQQIINKMNQPGDLWRNILKFFLKNLPKDYDPAIKKLLAIHSDDNISIGMLWRIQTAIKYL